MPAVLKEEMHLLPVVPFAPAAVFNKEDGYICLTFIIHKVDGLFGLALIFGEEPVAVILARIAGVVFLEHTQIGPALVIHNKDLYIGLT